MSSSGLIIFDYDIRMSFLVVPIYWDLLVIEDVQVILVTMDLFCYSPWNMENQGLFSCKHDTPPPSPLPYKRNNQSQIWYLHAKVFSLPQKNHSILKQHFNTTNITFFNFQVHRHNFQLHLNHIGLHQLVQRQFIAHLCWRCHPSHRLIW